MNSDAPPSQDDHRIVAIDRLQGALLVAFDNGQQFLCPANALYDLLSRGFEIVGPPELPKEQQLPA